MRAGAGGAPGVGALSATHATPYAESTAAAAAAVLAEALSWPTYGLGFEWSRIARSAGPSETDPSNAPANDRGAPSVVSATSAAATSAAARAGRAVRIRTPP